MFLLFAFLFYIAAKLTEVDVWVFDWGLAVYSYRVRRVVRIRFCDIERVSSEPASFKTWDKSVIEVSLKRSIPPLGDFFRFKMKDDEDLPQVCKSERQLVELIGLRIAQAEKSR